MSEGDEEGKLLGIYFQLMPELDDLTWILYTSYPLFATFIFS